MGKLTKTVYVLYHDSDAVLIFRTSSNFSNFAFVYIKVRYFENNISFGIP